MGYAYGSSVGVKKVIGSSTAALKNFNKCENEFENKTWNNESSAHFQLSAVVLCTEAWISTDQKN